MNLHFAMSQSDGLALTLLAVLGLSFSCILLLVYAIWRQRKRHDLEVEALMDELDQKEERPKEIGAQETPEQQPWERNADWWKS